MERQQRIGEEKKEENTEYPDEKKEKEIYQDETEKEIARKIEEMRKEMEVFREEMRKQMEEELMMMRKRLPSYMMIGEEKTEMKKGEYLRRDGIEEIIIPTTITKICDYCFYGCKTLKRLVIPTSVREIGEDILVGCESLTSIEIPGYSYMSNRAFTVKNCCLRSIELPMSLQMFNGKEKPSSPTEYEIPRGVTRIASRTFCKCDNLVRLLFDWSKMLFEQLAFMNNRCIFYSLNNPYRYYFEAQILLSQESMSTIKDRCNSSITDIIFDTDVSPYEVGICTLNREIIDRFGTVIVIQMKSRDIIGCVIKESFRVKEMIRSGDEDRKEIRRGIKFDIPVETQEIRFKEDENTLYSVTFYGEEDERMMMIDDQIVIGKRNCPSYRFVKELSHQDVPVTGNGNTSFAVDKEYLEIKRVQILKLY